MNTRLSCVATFLALFVLFGCSKSPSQYQNTKPEEKDKKFALTKPVVPEEATNPDGGVIEGKIYEEEQETEDKEVRKTSSEPIILGFGAAGINFNTTIDESRNILQKEQTIIEQAPLELHVYPEGVGVQWDKVSTQKPEIIMVMNGYLGELQMPEDYRGEPIKMGANLSRFFTEEDPEGHGLFNMMFKYQEGIPFDEEYDCFATEECQIMRSPELKVIIVQIGLSTALTISDDDRKAMNVLIMTSRFQLLSFKDPSKLGPDEHITTQVELLTGVLSDADTGQSLKFGDSLASLPQILKDAAEPRIAFDKFYLPYRAGQLILSRSDYSRDYLIPMGEETVTGIAISPSGKPEHDIYIQIDGRQYYVHEDGTVSTSRRPDSKKGHTKLPVPLGTSFNDDVFAYDRNMKTAFLTSLADKLTEKFKEMVGDDSFSQPFVFEPMVWGKYDSDDNTQFLAQAGYYDYNKQEAYVVDVISALNDFSVIYSVQRIDNIIEANLYWKRNQDVNAASGYLAGFDLGEEIELTDIDLSVDQATYKVGKDYSKRVTFKTEKSLKTLQATDFSGTKVGDKVINIDVVDMTGVTLGVQKTESGRYRIKSISASGFNTKISGICDSEEFTTVMEGEEASKQVRFGMSQIAFQKLFSTDYADCAYYSLANPDSSIDQNQYFFPQKKTAVVFEKNELASVMIYE